MFAVIAQMVEHFLGKEEVTGSIPVNSSRNQEIRIERCGFFDLCKDDPELKRSSTSG